MFRKILIANRGEIAIRIIRACKDMGIRTVAVYSTADQNALHTKLADEAICIGPEKSADSYLDMNRIISAAMATECDGIHPGYGFLSENADFADRCRENNITFIGPEGGVIRNLGDKAAARKRMIQAGVPVVPGSDGAVGSCREGQNIARKIGYPVLIKASAGGGGRGMRRVWEDHDFPALYHEAQNEAKSCFGNGDLYIEKLIENPKHIEFQILADSFGHIVHLGERDCSIQRKNQKLIEETPSRVIDDKTREEMGEVAIKAAAAGNYVNAGTVEFVVDANGQFYFIEMNTRVQVEHPITEMITGIDIVREQIRIAAGLPQEYRQEEIRFMGHAVECRINAEDAEQGFLPSPGHVDFVHFPGGSGVRVDSMLYSGCDVSPHYDPLVAKLITYGKTKLDAVRMMRRALEELVVNGIKTNQSLLYLIMYDPEFMKGTYDTGFLDRKLNSLIKWDRIYDELSETDR